MLTKDQIVGLEEWLNNNDLYLKEDMNITDHIEIFDINDFGDSVTIDHENGKQVWILKAGTVLERVTAKTWLFCKKDCNEALICFENNDSTGELSDLLSKSGLINK